MASGQGSGSNSRNWIPWFIVIVAFLTVALALLITAEATDHWIDTVLSRTEFTSNINKALAFSRYQGLYKTCYTGGDVTLLPSETSGRNTERDTITAAKDQCIWEEAYKVWSVQSNKYDTDYLIRAHVLRATIGVLGAGGLFIIVAMLLAFCGMCSTGRGLLSAVGAMSLIGAILILVGMGLFTWVYFLQFQQLGTNYVEFWNGWKASATYQPYVSLAKINFGWSYMLGWIAGGIALLGSILAFIALCCATPGQSTDNSNGQKSYKTKKQQVEPVYNTQYIPQDMVAVPNQRVDVVRYPAQKQKVETVMPIATYTGFESSSPPSYYNSPAVVYRPKNVTATPVATPFYQGEKVSSNGGYGTARIYNDAASTFTPREYVEAAKAMDIS